MSAPLASARRWVARGFVAAVLATPSAAPAATHTVVIEASAFAPASLELRAGDRVVFVNRDPFPHTATAAGGAFDSRAIAPSARFSYVAKRPGRIDYLCTLHPTMKGTLWVR